MKRSPMKRTQFNRPSPGAKQLRRTRLNTVGKRKKREAKASREFGKRYMSAYDCKCCNTRDRSDRMQAHHMCSRARGVGHPNLHDKRNRAWLCSTCHDETHRGLHPEFLKSRDFLDTLTPTGK